MSLSNSFTALALTTLFCGAALSQAIAPAATPIAAPAEAPIAAYPVLGANSPTTAEIQKISESMTVLQAQLTLLELQLKIAGRKRELNALNEDSTFSSFNAKKGNPSVVSVAGLKGQLEAVLVFPGGVTQRVKVGDTIDDRRVTQVSANEVVLTDLKGQKPQRLAFGNSPTIRDAAIGSATQAAPAYPGGPPAMQR